VVAVSGGGDSVALLHLFTDFARRRFPSLAVHTVTVDHALRPEAADEARQVAALAARLGVTHTTKRWDGDKPATAVIEAAREARHRLLAEAAQEAGADLVLVGHTLDDQAETVAMRGARGGGRGAAGMAAATLRDWRTWFARPLLGVRRTALRRSLVQAGHGWIEDPTNEDYRYERVRVRSALTDQSVSDLARQSAQAAAKRVSLGERAASMIGQYATMPAAGLIRIDPALTARDRETATYALRTLLAVGGGREHLPDAERTGALMERLSQGHLRATLAGAVADCRKAGIFLYRERRNLPQEMVSRTGVWDGRFRFDESANGTSSTGLPDRATVDALSSKWPEDIPKSLLRAAFSGLPAIWRDGECAGLATELPGATCVPVVAPWARYLPSFDYQPACAAARVIGAHQPPPPPLASHKERKP
jgi:tRNA(Ile)-lysidine synthase